MKMFLSGVPAASGCLSEMPSPTALNKGAVEDNKASAPQGWLQLFVSAQAASSFDQRPLTAATAVYVEVPLPKLLSAIEAPSQTVCRALESTVFPRTEGQSHRGSPAQSVLELCARARKLAEGDIAQILRLRLTQGCLLTMTDTLAKLSDCVVQVQGEQLPACSQVLGLQSELFADILQRTTLEQDARGRKVVPFADDEPAIAQLIEYMHSPGCKRRELMARQSLATAARLLSLADKYRFVDLAQRLLDDLFTDRRCAK